MAPSVTLDLSALASHRVFNSQCYTWSHAYSNYYMYYVDIYLQEHLKTTYTLLYKQNVKWIRIYTSQELKQPEYTTDTIIHSRKWLRVSCEYSSNAVVSSLCYTGLATYYTQ